jgi:hypothetical protein
MKSQVLVISIEGAATRLENYPGEVFDPTRFETLGLSIKEYHAHHKRWQHQHRICVMHFTHYRAPDLDLSNFDMVLIIDEEAIDSDPDKYLNDIGKKFNNPNVRIITSGYNQHYQMDLNRCYSYPFFFMNIGRLGIDQSCDPLQNYCKTFDVLLGMSKPHREFVFSELAAHRMLNQCFINLTTNRFHQRLQTIYRSPDLDKFEENDVMDTAIDVLDSYQHVANNGPRVSHVMPWKIYDKSLYSIVAETTWHNHWFFSEKTAKVLLAKRIFVFFGAANSLHVLRLMGFMTFDEIIDESYDTIEDEQQRFKAAFDQVQRLAEMPPQIVYQQAHRIVTHNQNHLRNRAYFIAPLIDWVNDIVSQSIIDNPASFV